MSEQNLALVRSAYDAFGRGDMDGLIRTLDADVEWITPGPPELASAGERRGHDEVRKFFGLINETYEFEKFDPHTFLAQGDTVIVLGEDTVKVKATGTVLSEGWCHAFTVKNGKVVRFREYLDTAAIVADLQTAKASA